MAHEFRTFDADLTQEEIIEMYIRGQKKEQYADLIYDKKTKLWKEIEASSDGDAMLTVNLANMNTRNIHNFYKQAYTGMRISCWFNEEKSVQLSILKRS